MSERQLTDGSPVPEDDSHKEINPATGQQRGYVVLSPAERAKGFVKPYRDSYVHNVCGVNTKMGRSLAETYQRDPYFYSGTFCVGCGAHFPLDQFRWDDGEPMDPELQEEWNAGREQQRMAAIAQRTAEVEALERAELARLKVKYENHASDVSSDIYTATGADLNRISKVVRREGETDQQFRYRSVYGSGFDNGDKK